MSTFYILPPRAELARQLAASLTPFLPGLDWHSLPSSELTEWLASLAERQPDVYVVHREDLPLDEELPAALSVCYGAEPGDVIIEVKPGKDVNLLVTPRQAA